MLIWTQPKHPELFQLGAFPVFYMEALEQNQRARYYGLPIFGTPGFKFGKYHHLEQKVIQIRWTVTVVQTMSDSTGSVCTYFPDAAGSNHGDENLLIF